MSSYFHLYLPNIQCNNQNRLISLAQVGCTSCDVILQSSIHCSYIVLKISHTTFFPMWFTHCGLVGPYGITDLDYHCFSGNACWGQFITWANADLLSSGSSETHFSDILIKLQTFSLKETQMKRNACLQNGCHFVQWGVSELMIWFTDKINHHIYPLLNICVVKLHNLFVAFIPWWRHQMETSSALLALWAGNSPVTGEFPSQRPVMRSLDIFFLSAPE